MGTRVSFTPVFAADHKADLHFPRLSFHLVQSGVPDQFAGLLLFDRQHIGQAVMVHTARVEIDRVFRFPDIRIAFIGNPFPHRLLLMDFIQALRILSEKHVDVMLLDIIMPQLDGFGVLEQMQLLPPESLNRAFGCRVATPEDKPTNGEFISLIADKLSLEEQQRSAL